MNTEIANGIAVTALTVMNTEQGEEPEKKAVENAN